MIPATTAEQYLSVVRTLGLIRAEQTTRALLKDVFRNIELTNRRLLDIGGGWGLYSFYAAILGAREVVCLEPEAAGSTEGVVQLFQRIRAALPEVPIRLDPRTVEQYRDAERFDVILMNASINHIDEQACIRLLDDPKARETFRQIFAHIASLAKPSARLIVVDCTRRNFFATLGLKNPLSPEIEWHKHQAPQVWARVLQDAGFGNPRINWQPLYRFGKAGQLLSSNKVAAYFLKGMFRLVMQTA